MEQIYKFISLRHIKIITLIVFLFGLYTNIGVQVGLTYVAGLVTAISGIFLLGLHILEGRNQSVVATCGWLSASALLWVLTIPFSPDPSGFGEEHLRSVAVLLTSMLGAYGAFLEIRSHSRPNVQKFCLYFAITVLVLAALETYTPFRSVSDYVRSHLYAGRYIYNADFRDILISGSVRPKVFTQEPSHVAKAVSVALAGAVILSTKNYRFALGFFGWIVAVFLLRSPTLLLSIGAVVAATVFNRPSRSMLLSTWRVIIVFTPVLSFIFLRDIISLLPFSRAQMIANGEDVSFLTRSIGPAMIAIETMKNYPIAGAGIGGRELVMDIVLGVYQQFPGYWLGRLTKSAGYTGWGNAFFEIFTYGGIVMSAIIIPAMLIALRNLNKSSLLIALIFFLTFNFDAGFVSARPWAYFCIIIAIIGISQRYSSAISSQRKMDDQPINSGSN